MTSFVFPILQKISTGYSFLKFVSFKNMYKNFKLNIWNFYLTSHPTNRLGSTSSLLLSSFWLPSHSLLLWRLLWLRVLLCFLLWLCFFFLLFHNIFLLWLRLRFLVVRLHSGLKFSLPQVSWFQSHKFTRILSKWVP